MSFKIKKSYFYYDILIIRCLSLILLFSEMHGYILLTVTMLHYRVGNSAYISDPFLALGRT